MKSKLLIISGIFFLAALLSCEQKMGEKEYFDMAQQYMEQQNWDKAAEYFEKTYGEFPDGLFSSKSLFMIGYINANHLKNFDKARKFYQEFVDKYPDHDLANDAKYELEHMGKSADELPFLKDSNGTEGETTSQTVSEK